jgi:hypothetical protein
LLLCAEQGCLPQQGGCGPDLPVRQPSITTPCYNTRLSDELCWICRARWRTTARRLLA